MSGRQLGHYRITELRGKRGMGSVAPDGSAVSYCSSIGHADMSRLVWRLEASTLADELPRAAGGRPGSSPTVIDSGTSTTVVGGLMRAA